MVLQENQVLIDQLEAQHVKAKASHSRHRSEGTGYSERLPILIMQTTTNTEWYVFDGTSCALRGNWTCLRFLKVFHLSCKRLLQF